MKMSPRIWRHKIVKPQIQIQAAIRNPTMYKIFNIALSSFNCKNIRSNLEYCKQLSSVSDILYLNELWIAQSEKPILDNLNINNKKILFKSDMDHNYKRGRPFGGQSWIINNNLNILDFEFINRHISYVIIETFKIKLVVIGVYLPFDNNTLNSKSEYELCLSLLSSLLVKFEPIEAPIFITGDFNSDLYRKNRFDIILNNFVNCKSLISLDTICTQEKNFTFKSIINNKEYKARLNHTFLHNKVSNQSFKFKNITCNIQVDKINMSDHNSIVTELEIEIDQSQDNDNNIILNKISDLRVDLNKPEHLNIFKDQIDFYFKLLNIETTSKEFETLNPQQKIDNFHEGISNSINKAYEMTYDLTKRDLIDSKNKNRKILSIEQRIIKSKILELKNSDPNNENKLKELRKEFRRIQRNNLYIEEQNEYS